MPFLFPYDASQASLFRPCAPPFFQGWVPTSDAALCCELSRLAYCGRETIESVLPSVSLHFLGEVSEEDSFGVYGFLARNEQAAFLVFRGTEAEDPIDIIDDAQFFPAPWEGGGLVHSGFAGALARV